MDKKITLEVGALILLVLAVALVVVGGKGLLHTHSAEEFEDKGVHTFVPQRVLPTPKRNTSTGREQRNNPTKTVYMLHYKTQDGSGYQWQVEFSTKSSANNALAAGQSVERRVLALKENGHYVTVEPQDDAKSYAASERKKFGFLTLGGALYLVIFLAVMLGRSYRDRKSVV